MKPSWVVWIASIVSLTNWIGYSLTHNERADRLSINAALYFLVLACLVLLLQILRAVG